MRKISPRTQIRKLKKLAEENKWEFYPAYSGRFMYGTSCAGIVTDSPDSCIKKASKQGVRGASIDNMGKSYIVYWKGIPMEEEES